MKKLKIGGVPEHFNLPWHSLLDSRVLNSRGVDCEWRDYPGGTGAMVEALNRDQLDVALMLTEGAVAGIANGGAYRIVSFYTDSPLIWGIHVPVRSALESVADLEGGRFAISRVGSGSHLMVYALAKQQGWPVRALRFVTVGSLDGAIHAFDDAAVDIFLWERFMTQPFVDKGKFRRVDELVAPWPAFVACASRAALERHSTAIADVLDAVLRQGEALAATPDTAERIADRYGLARGDAVDWLARTRWARRVAVDPGPLAAAVELLEQVELIDRPFDGVLTAAL